MKLKGCRPGVSASGVLGTLLLFLPSPALAQVPFYQGKTITIVHGHEAGGTGDRRVKAAIPFLQKYIPGNPTFMGQYMPGGGGRAAVNHVYGAARPDGFTIGNSGSSVVPYAVLGEPGVQYDLDKLIFLGAANSASQYVFVSRKDAGLNSLEKIQSASGLRIGANAVGHTIYIVGRLFTYLLGLKETKFVVGYSGAEVDLALIRGEVDARATHADTTLRRNPDWFEKGLVDSHVILEIPRGDKHPRFAHLPELESFARSDRERKLLATFRAFNHVGSPYFLPPGTPKDRVEILKEALRKTLNDPEFRKEYKKFTGDDPTPLMPEAQQNVIRELPRDPEVIELFKKLAGSGPLPPR